MASQLQPQDLRRAYQSVVAGQPAPQAEMLLLARGLKALGLFREASEVFERARSDQALARDADLRDFTFQQQALCISKDPARLADQQYAEAMEMLRNLNLFTTTDPETLGIAGGIAKRNWDVFRQHDRLSEALNFYERGWSARGATDDGYTGINYAYLLTASAHAEEQVNGQPTEASRESRATAQSVRRRIATDPDLIALARRSAAGAGERERIYWVIVTLAEAHVGLAFDDSRHHLQAQDYLEMAVAIEGIDDWATETTARQLSALIRLYELARPGSELVDRTWSLLDILLRNRAPGLRTQVAGKAGLALSGGGFRASLYHIGVLARLAELDLLRHVEVLSCVSGGSVVGCLYYLKLRALLESQVDGEIRRQDYVDIVRSLEREFLAAIQLNNFRLRVFEEPELNYAMIDGSASRTEILGELFDRVLYGDQQLAMSDLAIRPPGATDAMHPRHYNWGRKNKVPLLVINSTTLNTGHPWEFTPFEMGEPPLDAASEVDANLSIPSEAYAGLRVPLGRAVAASACVPALFEPVAPNPGPGRLLRENVLLVDGGLHDNQGASALLGNDCTLLLVSDGSGALVDEPETSSAFAAVAFRANDILQERLRVALYRHLEARKRSSLVRGVFFAHLKMGLRGAGESTLFGLNGEAQKHIAAIRTDLDVFNDVESLALMFLGYRLTEGSLSRQLPDFESVAAASQRESWDFLIAERPLTSQPSREVIALLRRAGSRFLKAWFLVPLLRNSGIVILVLIAGGLLATWIWMVRSNCAVQLSSIASWAGSTVLGLLAAKYLDVEFPNIRKWIARRALAFSGATLAWLHRRWIDPAYLRAGRREKFL